MDKYTYANPEFFYLLIPLVISAVWFVYRFNTSNSALQSSTLEPFRYVGKTYKYYLRLFLQIMRFAAMVLIIIVLARPQSSYSSRDIVTEGIDIMLSIDVSSSMLARDFNPNRIEAAKDVATKFVMGRENDRMGIVVFSGESFTQCPLTTDRAVLTNLLQELESGMIEDGTAIGLGLANAVNRLKDSKAKSRIVILLTDGVSNQGEIDPLTAADIAATFNIRVYTIGVGTRGMAPYPVETMFGTQYQQMEVEIDEETLQEISERTGGKYFRATSKMELTTIYEEINKLEKSKIEVKEYSNKEEEFLWFGLLAVGLMLAEVLIRYTILRKIP